MRKPVLKVRYQVCETGDADPTNWYARMEHGKGRGGEGSWVAWRVAATSQ